MLLVETAGLANTGQSCISRLCRAPTPFSDGLQQGKTMAGTSENKSGTTGRQVASPVPYLEYDEFVEIQISKTRENLRSNEIITALTELAVLFAGYLLIVVVCDHWLVEGGLSTRIRFLLLVALVMTAGIIAVRRVFWPLIRRINPLYAARMIEQAEGRFQGNLVNWIDLKANGRNSEHSAAIRAIEKRAAVGLDRMDVDTAVDRRPLLRAAYALLGVVVVSAMYVAFSPKDPFSSVHRALLPLSAVGVPTETTISDITPGSVDVPARSQVTVEADLRGKSVEKVQVLLTTADHKFVDHPVEMRRIESGLPRFRGILNGENGRGLLQDHEYRIVAGDAESPTFRIRVIQPPSALVEQLTYTYPNYMQLQPRVVPGPAVEGWEGTKVALEARTNLPVSQARLILTDSEQATQGEEIPLQIFEGTRLSGGWTLGFRSDGTAARFYHIAVKTADGAVDPNPVRIPIEVRADQRPDVALLSPTGDLEKPANAIIPLAIVASDPDFQLRSLTLKSERNGTPLPDQALFESEFPTRKLEGTVDWDLGALGLQQGERIQYWIEARDNRQPVANRTNTPRLSLLIEKPFESDQQAQRDLADAKNQLQDELASARPPDNPGEGVDEPSRADNPSLPTAPPRPNDDAVAREPGNADSEESSQDSSRNDDRHESAPGDPAEFQEQLERVLRREEQSRQQPETEPREPSDSVPHRHQQDDESEEPRQSSDDPAGERSHQDRTPSKSGTQEGKSGPSGSKPSRNQADDESPDDSSEEEGASRGNSTGTKSNPSSGKSESAGNREPRQLDSHVDEPQELREEPQSKATEGGSDAPDKTTASQSGKTRRGNGEDPNIDAQQESPERSGSPQEGSPREGATGDEDDSQAGEQTPRPSRQDPELSGKSTDRANSGSESEGDPSPKSEMNDRAESDSASEARESATEGQQSTKPGGKPSEIPSGERPPRRGENSPAKRGQSSTSGSEEKSETPQEDSSRGGSGEQSGSQQTGKSKNQSGSGSQGGNESSRGESGEPGPDQSPNDGSPPSNDSPDSGQQSRSSVPKRSKSGKSGQQRPSKEPGESASPSDSTDSAGGPDAESPKGQESSPANDPEGTGTKSSRSKSNKDTTSRSGNTKSPSDSRSEESPARPTGTADSVEHDEDASERSEEAVPRQTPSNRPKATPEAGNQTPRGKGRPEGQRSQQPSTGEQGRSSSSDQGESRGNQEGAGEQTGEAGESSPTSRATGKTAAKPGSGKTGDRPSSSGRQGSGQGSSGTTPESSQEGAAGTQGSESGSGSSEGAESSPDSESGSAGDSSTGSDSASGRQGGSQGKSSGNSLEGAEGSPAESTASGQSGAKSSTGAKSGQGADAGNASSSQSQTGGGRFGSSRQGSEPSAQETPPARDRKVPDGRGRSDGQAGSGESGVSSEDAMNSDEEKLEHLREASNLVLQKLKGQLSRGELDPESLEELGWKDLGQLRKFVNRLEEELSPSDDHSPEALARRRQFEELLKSMTLDDTTQLKERGTGAGRRVEQVDAGRRPVPSALRSRYEAYTRSLSKGDKGPEKASAKPSAARNGTP